VIFVLREVPTAGHVEGSCLHKPTAGDSAIRGDHLRACSRFSGGVSHVVRLRLSCRRPQWPWRPKASTSGQSEAEGDVCDCDHATAVPTGTHSNLRRRIVGLSPI
jgi:hypothetical protein